jgi:hypothetical protein
MYAVSPTLGFGIAAIAIHSGKLQQTHGRQLAGYRIRQPKSLENILMSGLGVAGQEPLLIILLTSGHRQAKRDTIDLLIR